MWHSCLLVWLLLVLECVTHLSTYMVTVVAGVCDTLGYNLVTIRIGAEVCDTLVYLSGYSWCWNV